MTNILIIGATGSIGSTTRKYFLEKSDDYLTLMARDTSRLSKLNMKREQSIAGSVSDSKILCQALQGQDAVFAALRGDMAGMARVLVNTMDEFGPKRLIFLTSMGIYNEVPASVGLEANLKNNPELPPYREAADIIEASDLNYTLIRPCWFDDGDDIDYELTQKGETFGGHDISRKSIADLVMQLTHDPNFESRKSLGINRKQKE